MNKEIISKKYQLVKSKEWQLIRSFMFEHIKSLAVTEMPENIIKGMLRNIHDTDKWESNYLSEIEED